MYTNYRSSKDLIWSESDSICDTEAVFGIILKKKYYSSNTKHFFWFLLVVYTGLIVEIKSHSFVYIYFDKDLYQTTLTIWSAALSNTGL